MCNQHRVTFCDMKDLAGGEIQCQAPFYGRLALPQLGGEREGVLHPTAPWHLTPTLGLAFSFFIRYHGHWVNVIVKVK